jgi:hypothetical protein
MFSREVAYTNCKVFRLTQAHTFTPLMQLRSNAHIKQTLLHKVYNFLTLQNSINYGMPYVCRIKILKSNRKKLEDAKGVNRRTDNTMSKKGQTMIYKHYTEI